MSKTLVAQAIADAKEFKKLAIEEARLKLVESVTPELKAILEATLAEEAEQAEEEEAVQMKDEAYEADPEEVQEEVDEKDQKEADEAFDIESALAEIEQGQLEENDDKNADEAPEEGEKEEETQETPKAGKDEAPAPAPAPAPEEGEEAPEEDELDEDYISRILSEIEESDDAGMEDEVTVNEEMEEEGSQDEGVLSAISKILKKLPAEAKEKWEKALGIDKIKAGGSYAKLSGNLEETEEVKEVDETEEAATEAELLELKNQLFEMNLLSAKLMFQNKLLLSENFSDTQKARIIVAFDKAKTVNEVKLIFETLDIKAKKPTATPVSESLGFRRIGQAAPLHESKNAYDPTDPVVADMMRRAGIKK